MPATLEATMPPRDDDRAPLRYLSPPDHPVVIACATWPGAVEAEGAWLLAHSPTARPLCRAMRGLPDGRVLDLIVLEVDDNLAGVTFDVSSAFPGCIPPSDAELAMMPWQQPT